MPTTVASNLTTAQPASLTTAQVSNLATAPATTVTPPAPIMSTNYTPSTIVVDPKSTVAGNLDELLKTGSPLMQTAATQSRQQANSRGLMNSSMAVQAGQQAMINSALPIAQQDATTRFTAQRDNMAAANSAGQFNASQSNDIAKTNQAATTQTNQFNATQQNNLLTQRIDNEFKTALANSDAGTRVQLQQMQSDTQKQLANIQADYQTLMQTSSSAATIYSATVSQIAEIVKDTNMNADAKAAAINGLTSRMSTQLNLVGSINGVDLTGLLDFGTVTGA